MSDRGLAGAHLEGPFLAPEHAGVHRRELLRAPGDGIPRHYFDPCVRLVTLAPELPGALELVAALRARGVVVVRATGASGAEALVAATTRPARAIGRSSGLTPGACADLVLADADGRPRRVMRGGRWLEREAP